MKEILKNSFYQLIFLYSLVIFFISLGFLWKYSLQFHILAIFLGLLGFFLIDKKEENKKINRVLETFLIFFSLLLMLFFRLIPYKNGSVPLGYDLGLYRYAILHGLEFKDLWILRGGMEPGFLYLMEILKIIFDVDFILKVVFLFFSLLLGISIWIYTRRSFGKLAGTISLIIYSLSVVQFKVFSFLYYKNVIALSLLFFSLLLLNLYEKKRRLRDLVSFVLLSGMIGAIHRPTFYLFGLSFFLYSLIRPYKKGNYDFKEFGKMCIAGFLILGIALSFYLGDFFQSITDILPFVLGSFISPGESPGTFISFGEYVFLVLAYLPFSIIGFFYIIRNKKELFLSIIVIVNLIIVYFQLFFFNRFIIYLDVFFIILSGIGFSVLINKKIKLGLFVLIIVIFSLAMGNYHESSNSLSILNNSQIDFIRDIKQNVEENSSIISISSEYSPYLIGYLDFNGRRIIAPGLFDSNLWNESEWDKFWKSGDIQEVKEMLKEYDKPIYVYSGTKSFNNPCFEVYIDKMEGKLYKYSC